MSDRNKALEAFGRIYSESYTQDDWWIVEDALNRFSNLTSPETIEKGVGAFLDAVDHLWNERHTDFVKLPVLTQEQTIAYAVRLGLEAVLRSVEDANP